MKRIIAFLLALACTGAFLPANAAGPAIELYDYYAVETLPKIYIETENGLALDDPSLIKPDEKTGTRGELPVYDYVNAAVTVRDCEGYEFEAAAARVRIRGNYTATYPKHPMRIKFDRAWAMCGLNDGQAMKNWVLLAEYKDSSLLRNSTIFYIANSLYSTTGNYCTDFRNVEVYINGEYYGLYVLCEQQQVNEYRVDLPEPTDPEDLHTDDLTEQELAALKDGHTGYLLEYDGYYFNEDPSVTFSIRYDEVTRPNGQTFLPSSAANEPRADDGGASGEASRGFGFFGFGRGVLGDTRQTGFTIKSDIYYEEQNAFIRHTMQTVWDVLYDAVYTDHSDLSVHPYHTMDGDGNYIAAPAITTAYDAVASVVDVDSLVDMYILQELAQDGDLDWSSIFFAVDMSPEGSRKLVYTAPWDFDSAFNGSTDRLYVMNDDNPWFVLFYGQDWFWQRLSARWDEGREAGIFTGVIEMLDTVTAVNADAYDRNAERWSRSGIGSPGPSGEVSGETGNAHVRAEESLRSWLEARISALDGLIDMMAEGAPGPAS